MTTDADNRKYLIIDGNYFGHRAIHGLRITNPMNTLSTQKDMLEFNMTLNSQLESLILIWKDMVDQIIFVFDHKSWRRDISPYQPYYITDILLEPIGYKANREELKEKDDIDWDSFNFCLDEFRTYIANILPVFHFKGAEGDDAILLLVNKLQGTKVIFCTDGDLKQLVNDDTILYRNIRSKVAPDGEIVISKGLHKKIFKGFSSALEMLNHDSTKFNWYNQLFKLKMDSSNPFSTNRSPEAGSVTIAQPKSIAFIKSIIGDKKDNIFPLFRWKSGTRNMKVTEKMIERALSNLFILKKGEKIVDDKIEEYLESDNLLSILINLRDITKQVGCKGVKAHYDHNQIINVLDEKNLPESVKLEFELEFSKNQSLIYDGEYPSINKLKTADSGVLITSVPNSETSTDILDILK